nr:hypothetical protein GCM10011355_22430 [Aquisalinus luteolus]
MPIESVSANPIVAKYQNYLFVDLHWNFDAVDRTPGYLLPRFLDSPGAFIAYAEKKGLQAELIDGNTKSVVIKKYMDGNFALYGGTDPDTFCTREIGTDSPADASALGQCYLLDGQQRFWADFPFPAAAEPELDIIVEQVQAVLETIETPCE